MIRRADQYGPANTLDLLKWIALLTMTIDHIGFFLLPDLMWFRVIGRASFAIWLFLAGYHAAAQEPGDWRKIKQNLPLFLLGAVVLTLSHVAISKSIFPLTILLTILFVQILFAIKRVRHFIEAQPLTVVVYALIALPTYWITEYGSLGLMFAVLGLMVRKGTYEESLKVVGFIVLVIYTVMSNMTFRFSSVQEYTVIALAFSVVYWMGQFKVKPWKTKFEKPICLLTRNSYYYYVGHLLLIKALATWLNPPAQFFQFQWIKM